MAQTLTAAELLKIQALVTAMFGENTPHRNLYREPVRTAEAMFDIHRSTTNPIQEQNGKYRGVEVNWLKRGGITADYDGDGTTGSPTWPVDLSSGQAAESDSKLYTNNVKIKKVVEVDDTTLYKNLFDYNSLVVNQLAVAQLSIRKALNARWIAFLDANKTAVNLDSNLPTGLTWDAGNNQFVADGSIIDLQSPRSLTDIDALAENNLLGSYNYISGRRNFYNAVTDAEFRALNDNERERVRFGRYDIYFDIRDLDSTLSDNNTFIVQDGSYTTWDYIDAQTTAVPEQFQDNAFQFYITDPVLNIYQNGVIRPVRYNVYYQRIPQAGNTDTLRRGYIHRWELTFNGGIWVAPPSEDGHTGIMKIVSQSGV